MLLPWVQVLDFTRCGWRGDGELLGDVVQDAARLDDVGLLVQRALMRETELHQAPEAPLHGAEGQPHDVVDLRVGLVEARLLLVGNFRHGSQDVFAQIVAFPTFKEDTRPLKC